MNSKKGTVKVHSEVTALDSPAFPVSVSELRQLMKCSNNAKEAVEVLNNTYSGVIGLALKLKSNIQTGLSSDDQELQSRVKFYGRNEIPPKPPKSIFVLAFEAIQDPTLIMLMICSAISIGLSFYHPASEASAEVSSFS